MIQQSNQTFPFLNFPPYISLSEGWNEYYKEISEFNINYEGHTSPIKQYMMSSFILASNCQLFYEVGLNLGHCSWRLLNTLRYTGGKLLNFEIDTSKTPVESALMRIFPRNYLGTVWGDSNETLAKITEPCDIIHIDGGHSFPCFKNDLDLAIPLVKSGGFFFIDDAQVDSDIYRYSKEVFGDALVFFPDPTHNIPFCIAQQK